MTARLPALPLAAALVALTGSACIDENILDQMADALGLAEQEGNLLVGGCHEVLDRLKRRLELLGAPLPADGRDPENGSRRLPSTELIWPDTGSATSNRPCPEWRK
jgi:hypothetical protein